VGDVLPPILIINEMKANLEFNLPEDEFDYRLCNQASNMWSALIDIKDYLRSELKYNSNLTEGDYEMLESVQRKYFEIISDNNIILET
jgi:hypothetical protein